MNLNKKIRICHIVLFADLSGSKRSMLEILKNLNDYRYEKYVISNGEGELVDVLANLHIRSLKVPLVREISPINDIKAFFSIYLLCRKYKFHVVHTHSSKPGVLGRIAARLAGVKIVIHHVRGFAFHEFSSLYAKILYGLIEKVAGWFCDKVIFVNDEERRYSISKRILPRHKCVTILNGVDSRKFDVTQKKRWREKVREELNIPDNANVITFAGRLCAQKNPATLHDTIISYFGQNNEETYFLILGDGPYLANLHECFRSYPWGNRVLMLGWRNDVEKYLAASDIFFLPSLWEGMPRTILEAMAMGVAVVSSDIKGNREAVDNGVTGYIVPARACQMFSQRLAELVSDRSKREEFGRKACHKAKKCYDSQMNSKRIIVLYEELLRSKVGGFVHQSTINGTYLADHDYTS